MTADLSPSSPHFAHLIILCRTRRNGVCLVQFITTSSSIDVGVGYGRQWLQC